jgi:hypothetical protein
MCGIQLARTTAHHPAANGLVERFHQTLKAVIMCHSDQQWTEALPLVLLGSRMVYKEDLEASVSELVYGEPLRIPGELLTPTQELHAPAVTFISLLASTSEQPSPRGGGDVGTSHNARQTTPTV